MAFDHLTRRAMKVGTLGKAIVTAARAGRFKAPLNEDSIIALEYPVRPIPRYGYSLPRLGPIDAMLEAGRGSYAAQLQRFVDLSDDLARIPYQADGSGTGAEWNNDWLSDLDAIALYGLMIEHKPATYVEIGSGFSTKFARLAVQRHNLETRMISIDPQPRAEIDALTDECHRLPLEDADLTVFDRVRAGDVVFFDGSHCCFTNSDVTVFFLEVLPRLASGTLVHIHDIFLPYDYPPHWSNRFYSEQYLLAAFMLGGASFFEVLLPNHFCAMDEALAAIVAPLGARLGIAERMQRSTSFWLRIN